MEHKHLHRGWVIFFGLCIYYFVAYGLLYSSFGLFLPPMSTDLGISYGVISLAPAIRVLAGALVTSFLAGIFRKANLRVLISCGLIVMAAAIFLLSVTTQAWQILALFVIVGLCCGICLYSVIPIILNQWFLSPAAMISIVIACGGAGGIVIAPVMSNLIHSIGWRHSYLIMAAGVLVLMLPVAALLMDYSPAKRGLSPAEGIKSKSRPTTLVSVAAQDDKAYTKPNMILCIIFFFFGSLAVGMYSHIASALTSKGFDPASQAVFISLFQLGIMLFQLIPGFISSWVNPNKVAFISLPLLAIGAVAGIFITYDTPFVLIAIIMILLGGVMLFSSFNSIYARYVFGNSRFDQAYSKLQTFSLVGTAASLFVYGSLYSAFGSYTPAFLLSTVSLLIALSMVIVLRARVDKKNLLRTA